MMDLNFWLKIFRFEKCRKTTSAKNTLRLRGRFVRPPNVNTLALPLHIDLYLFDISQLWDKIETWGFREDLHLEPPHDPIVYININIYLFIYI